MSEYRKLVAEFLERYEKPVVDGYTQGFSGIDPQKKIVPGELDHEQLNGLLGGEPQGHYHLTENQLDDLIGLINDKYSPELMQVVIEAVADEEIDPYEMQGKNLK